MAKKKRKATGVAKGYLHGYTRDEQDRLYRQARFFEPYIYDSLDYSRQRTLLEVGCGVGAQTEILLRRFPHLRIQGVDSSATQLARARKHLSSYVRSGQVSLQVADALHLPFGDNRFDSAFLCWILEHVQRPLEILQEVRRTLAPGGVITCTEVLNSSFFVHPYSPATLQYWLIYNDHQWNLGGDPFVGAKLANYLQTSGYQNIETRVIHAHYDNRFPKRRAQIIEEWTKLLLSGAPGLIQAKKVSLQDVEAMRKELSRLKDDPNGVFFYSFVQAKAQAL